MDPRLLHNEKKPFDDVELPFDAETPLSDTSLKNVVSNFKSPAGDIFADPCIAKVTAKVYACIAKAWKLDDSDAARMLDVNLQTWMHIKNGKWDELFDQKRLRLISAIIALYETSHSCFNDELADSWIKLPNTGWAFSGRAPIDVMIEGGLPAILKTRRYLISE